MAVQSLKGSLQLNRKVQRIQCVRLATPLLGHLVADMLPQVTEHWHFSARDVVCYRNAWQLDDATLDGIHEGKVAHGPGEQCALRISAFALRQFKTLHGLTGQTAYCFPNAQKNGHVDVKSISKIVGDCQSNFKTQAKPLKGRRNDNSLVLNGGANGNWTPHDLRRTGSTMLQAMGEDLNMIDRCQNHKIDEPKTRAHYMHFKYFHPKRKIWERLGLEIENILAGGPDWQEQY